MNRVRGVFYQKSPGKLKLEDLPQTGGSILFLALRVTAFSQFELPVALHSLHTVLD